ncbi:MAG: lanthionine synthetase LanC family protein [Wenzhouxiangellaceae bacterium]
MPISAAAKRCEVNAAESPAAPRTQVNRRCAELADAASASFNSPAPGTGATAGLVEFLYAWSRHAGDADAERAADRWLDVALEQLATGHHQPWWIGGLTGVAWSLRRALVLRGEDTGEFSQPVDELLDTLLAAPEPRHEFDLILGSAGFGLYAAEHPDAGWRHRLGEAVVGHLEHLAKDDPAGRYWYTPVALVPHHQQSEFPNGYRNLSLAHGTAGVIGALARLHLAGVAGERTGMLLRDATAWLMSQRTRAPGDGNETAFVFANIADMPDVSRPLSWCYGDLGVSLALVAAGLALGDPAVRQFGTELALECTARTGESSCVFDPGLCHGAAGAALIFHRFWQFSGQATFAEASEHWLQIALEMRDDRFPESAGVFCVRGGAGQRHADLSPLTGLAGVGLAALGCVGGDQPGWDAPYLINIHSLIHSTDKDTE